MAEYIERQAFLSDIDAAMKYGGMGYVVGQTIKRFIMRQDSADVVEVVHGRWDTDCRGIIICSECGNGYNLVPMYTHYCPNCGARMDGE